MYLKKLWGEGEGVTPYTPSLHPFDDKIDSKTVQQVKKGGVPFTEDIFGIKVEVKNKIHKYDEATL